MTVYTYIDLISDLDPHALLQTSPGRQRAMARLCADELRLPQYERAGSKIFIDHSASVCIVAKNDVFRTFPLPRPPSVSDDGERQFEVESPGLREKTVTDVPPGNILEVRFSQDLGLMAVQRSDHELLIRDVEASQPTQTMLDCTRTRGAKADRRILDWWWVSPIDGRPVLLLVTTTSIELYAIGPDEVARGQDSYRATATEKVEGAWCRFEPTAEVLMVATGSASSMLKLYKINTGARGAQRAGFRAGSPGGGGALQPLQKLPNIDVELRGARSTSSRAAAARLERDDVLVAPLYNSLYVLRMERLERKLLLYPIGAPARPLEIKLFSQSDHLDVAVVDNVMILHDMAVKTSMMYDIKLSTEFPVVPPFSLLQPHGSQGVKLYGRSWTFAQPDYICDEATGVAYYIGLDLDEVVRMSTDKVWLMEYLLRRRGSKRWVRELLLHSMLQAESLPTVARLLKLVNQFYFFINYRVKKTTDKEEQAAWDNWGKRTQLAANPSPPVGGGGGSGGGWLAGVDIVDDHVAGAAASGGAASSVAEESAGVSTEEEEGDPVINQVEFYHAVLMPLQDGAAGADAETSDSDSGLSTSTSYLVAVLLEYIRSLHEHNIKVHHCFYTAVISALTQCSPPRYYQLHQLLQYHVLDDSTEVAMKVLALKQNYPPAAQQGIDMLHRLELHNDVVEVLLDDQQVRTYT